MTSVNSLSNTFKFSSKLNNKQSNEVSNNNKQSSIQYKHNFNSDKLTFGALSRNITEGRLADAILSRKPLQVLKEMPAKDAALYLTNRFSLIIGDVSIKERYNFKNTLLKAKQNPDTVKRIEVFQTLSKDNQRVVGERRQAFSELTQEIGTFLDIPKVYIKQAM